MSDSLSMDEAEDLSWEPRAQTVPSTWLLADFGEAFEAVSVNQKKVPAKAYKPAGLLPVVDQGQAFIGGYTDDESLAIDPGEGLIVFGDHTRVFKRVAFPFAAGADGIKVLRPRLSGSKYAHYSCMSLQFPNRGYSRHYSFLAKCKVPIAPEKEQERIVCKIDELFSRIEEGERALGRVQKLVERYRQSVLKAAVSGELTRDWREKNKSLLESGKALLERILKVRREAWDKAEWDKMKTKDITPADDKWKQKYEEPSPPDTNDLPELPTGWVWAAIGQLCDLENGDRSQNYPSRAHYVESGVPFINAGHIEEGRLDVEGMNFITEERFKMLRAGHVQAGDLLFCLRGSLGKVALNSLERGAIASSLVIIRPAVTNLTRYLMIYLQGPIATQQIGLYDNGTAQPNLAGADLARFAVPLPPLSEQGAIIDAAEQRLEMVGKQGADLQVFLKRSCALRSAVLKAAFSGLLVAQDRADDHASALLERVATERESAPAKPRRGRKNKNGKAT